MKKLIASILFAVFLLFRNAAVGQNDTIYVIQDGVVLWKHVTSSLDSIIFYDPSSIDTTTSIKDVDGNMYTSVIIGIQEWMLENLRTTKYSDGIVIPNLTGITEWANDTIGAWCNYDNDSQYHSTYGKLYNWYAVETGKLCPKGWHVPTDAEWTLLTDYLASDGHSGAEGAALKATLGWNDYNGQRGNGTDDYGWLGLPGVVRSSYGNFSSIGSAGYWWSSSQSSAGATWSRSLSSSTDVVSSYSYSDEHGFSVRCLRD